MNEIQADLLNVKPKSMHNAQCIMHNYIKRKNYELCIMNYELKKGFTLAEVLITLAIIGVVAAMTIPTLIQKHEEQVTLNKVKKIYSVISQAYLNIAYNYGPVETWGEHDSLITANNLLAERLKPYLKIMKDCGHDVGCFPNVSYKHFNSITYGFNPFDENSRYMLLLADGSALALYLSTNSDDCVIYYDINAQKGPNQAGKDLFQFDLYQYTVKPAGTGRSYSDAVSSCLDRGYACTSLLITNGNLDYIHCPDKFREGKNKCN